MKRASVALVTVLLLAGCQSTLSQETAEPPADANQRESVTASSETHTESGFPREHIDSVQQQFEALAPSIVKVGDEFSYGTGWVLDDRHILTNWHVVDPMTNPVSMKTFEGELIYGTVIATEEFDDIAVIRLEQPTSLPPLPLAKTPLNEREAVFFVGHPGSIGDWIIGVGITSASDFPSFVTSTLPVDPGASGSPMFNLSGEVVALISGCMRLSGIEEPPVGNRATVHSVIPGPPIADNCGGTEIAQVKAFADQAIEAQ
jgi:serine protease Do